MPPIANERSVLAHSLLADTANPGPPRPALSGAVRAETVGWGASGRNGGQVNPGLKDGPAALARRFGADLGGRMTQLSGAGGALVYGLIEKHKIRCDARRVGWIRAAHTRKALASLPAVAAEWRATGAPVVDLDAAESQRLLGTPGHVGGIIDRRGGNLYPLNYTLGLADAAERAGARLHGDSRVTDLGPDGDLVAVTTAEGRVTARHVLICTNADTGGLADPLGKTVVPIASVQVATAPLSSNVAASILPEGHAPSDTRRLPARTLKGASSSAAVRSTVTAYRLLDRLGV
jgi:glycine/D-amino acid oxidase-like deaminating enzyme